MKVVADWWFSLTMLIIAQKVRAELCFITDDVLQSVEKML